MGRTHRRHSAQDTGTRPGLRRCLGGGSLPEGEPEPCTALNGRIEHTVGKGKSGVGASSSLASLKGEYVLHLPKKIELLVGPCTKGTTGGWR
jgi:hypothetical protein